MPNSRTVIINALMPMEGKKVATENPKDNLSTHIKIPMTESMREDFKQACYIDRTNMAEVVRKFVNRYLKKERSL